MLNIINATIFFTLTWPLDIFDLLHRGSLVGANSDFSPGPIPGLLLQGLFSVYPGQECL